MADEELDLENLDKEIEKENKVEKRIKDLSEKVRLTSEERDELNQKLAEREKKIQELETQNKFNTGFADILGEHPEAKDHRDEIWEKVKSGYSPEDAAFAVLGKAGKLGQKTIEKVEETSQPAEKEIENPAGGSATTNPPQGEEKPISGLSRDEKRAKLIELEKRGDISVE